MRGFALFAFFVLLAVGIAGCSEKPQKADVDAKSLGGARATKAVNRTDIEKRLNRTLATTGQESMGDWFVLSASASPEGNLTGFRLNIPDGALVPGRFGGSSAISMEVVPIVVGAPDSIKEWLLMPFILDAGRARLPGNQLYFTREPTFIMETARKEADVALPNPSSSDLPISVAPRFLSFSDQQLRSPGSLFFVVAAKSATPTEFGIAIRLLDHVPQGSEKPSPDLETFLLDIGRAVPFGIKRVGVGNGFVIATYETYTGLLNPQPVSHMDVRSNDVKVEDRAAARQVPALQVRDTTVSSVFEPANGWTYAYIYYNSACATGKYAAKIEAHGKTYTPRGVIMQHVICGALYGAIASAIVFGYQVEITFAGEGAGPSRLSFDFQVAHATIETLRYAHIAFGMPLSTLLGQPAMPVQRANQGVAGNVPPGE